METPGQALKVFLSHRRCKLLQDMFVVQVVAGDNALQMGERKTLKGEDYLLVRRRLLMAAAFVLSLVVIVVFGIRAFHQAPRKKSSERIRPWMSLKYVARAHRVPPQLMGIVPGNTGGFGAVLPAAQVFSRNSLQPLMSKLLELNDWMGMEVVRFDPYVVPTDGTTGTGAGVGTGLVPTPGA
mgnify:CR=1 FL=1